MTDELWRWTAADLVQAIRTRKVSSREAVDSCLARLDAVNPKINAVVDVMADEARAAADAADAAVRQGAPLGVLHGVPVTVKINVDVTGRATTNGVVAFKDAIAAEDSVPVANLRKAGAVIFGRTNVPGFSTRYFTDNDLHGRTLNPFAPGRTPGGSSGGAAAAVAAGIGPIGHGNDRAGSVRYPAYACGVFGLRPSLGRIADHNPSSVEERGLSSQMAHAQGPLARSVEDLRLALTAFAVRDARDPWYVPAPLGRRRPGPCAAAVFAGPPGAAVEPAVKAAVELAAKWLADAGYRVEEAAPPDFTEAAHMFWSLLMTEERAASTAERAASSRAIEAFGDAAVQRARASTRAYAAEYDFDGYIRALARRSAILRAWNLFFERYPILVMPVSFRLPVPVDLDQQGDAAVRGMLDAHHPMLVGSVLGLPGLAAPTGLADGVPAGVQIVAARYREDLILAAGEVIEARGGTGAPIDPRD
ncbi:MAG: amidase family protein [Rhodospirillaceae bacterium]